MASITLEARQSLVALYVGMFSAAPGSSNLSSMVQSYEGGKTLKQIAADLDNADFRSQYPAFLTADEFADRLVSRLLGSEVGAAQTTWATNWVKNKLTSGVSDTDVIVEAVNALRATANTAYDNAKASINNKVEVAEYYSITKEQSSDSLSTLQSVISGVTSDSATVTTAKTSVDDAAAVVQSQSFTLTTGVDQGAAFTGGAGNDFFSAVLSGTAMTLNPFDSIDGGAGNDTLNITVNGSVTPASVANIETVTASFTGAATLDLSNGGAVTKFTSQGSTAATTVSGLSKAVAFEARDTSQNHTVNYKDATGLTDEATITLGNVSGGTLTAAAIETLTLNSVTAANTVATLTTANTSTLKVTGDQNLTVTNNLGATVTTVDASAATGSVDVDFGAGNVTATGGAGNDSFSFEAAGTVTADGGAGNDTFTFDATGTYTTADTVTGGEGTDTLSATSANLVTASATTPTTYKTTGVEYITANTAVANAASLNISNISTSATRLNLTAANAGTATFTFNAGASELRSAVATVGGQTLDAIGTATDDSITLSATAAVDYLNGQTLATTDFETVTINTSTLTTQAQTVGTITSTASTGGTPNLVFSGNNQITTGVITNTGGTIDASGLTGTTGLIMVTGQNTASTITGSAGADTLFGAITTGIAQTISGGAGNDSITAGAGNDTITGGDGDDTVNSGGGTDSVDLGAGNDTVTVSADANLSSGDSIVGGDGTDVISFTADMTDGASTLQAFSGFETLRLAPGAAESLTMSNFLNTTNTLTSIEFGDAGGNTISVTNASASITNLQLGTNAASITGDAVTFDRLIDGTSNSITIKHDSGGNAATVSNLTIDDEETVTITTDSATDDLTLTAVDSADMTSLTLTGAGDIIITAFSAATDMPSTVDASGMTGASTVPLTNSTLASTMTGGSGVDTFTGGANADTINGNGGADVLSGGNGADTITGGEGADTITGGGSADIINLAETVAAVDKVVVDDTNAADTINDFKAGTGGDKFQIDISAVGSAPVDGNSDALNAGDTIVLETVGTGAAQTLDDGDNIFVITSTIYANDTAGRAAIIANHDTGSTDEIQFASAITDGEDIYIVWSDGTDAYLGLWNLDADTTTTTEIAVGGTNSITTLGVIKGLSNLALLHADNFEFI